MPWPWSPCRLRASPASRVSNGASARFAWSWIAATAAEAPIRTMATAGAPPRCSHGPVRSGAREPRLEGARQLEEQRASARQVERKQVQHVPRQVVDGRERQGAEEDVDQGGAPRPPANGEEQPRPGEHADPDRQEVVKVPDEMGAEIPQDSARRPGRIEGDHVAQRMESRADLGLEAVAGQIPAVEVVGHVEVVGVLERVARHARVDEEPCPERHGHSGRLPGHAAEPPAPRQKDESGRGDQEGGVVARDRREPRREPGDEEARARGRSQHAVRGGSEAASAGASVPASTA